MSYELIPTNGRKSFYGKARVEIDADGSRTLFSYGTKICTLAAGGELSRHYYGKRTNTTSAHVKSFLGEERAAEFWRMK